MSTQTNENSRIDKLLYNVWFRVCETPFGAQLAAEQFNLRLSCLGNTPVRLQSVSYVPRLKHWEGNAYVYTTGSISDLEMQFTLQPEDTCRVELIRVEALLGINSPNVERDYILVPASVYDPRPTVHRVFVGDSKRTITLEVTAREVARIIKTLSELEIEDDGIETGLLELLVNHLILPKT